MLGLLVESIPKALHSLRIRQFPVHESADSWLVQQLDLGKPRQLAETIAGENDWEVSDSSIRQQEMIVCKEQRIHFASLNRHI